MTWLTECGRETRSEYLDSRVHPSQHFPVLHLSTSAGMWLQASQAIAPDHMVEVGQQQLRTRMSVGSHLVRENGTTGHKAMTLPKRKVTAQVAENCSC